MFTLTVFQILLSKGRSVLWPTHWSTRTESLKVSVKNQKYIPNLFKLLEKWLTYRMSRFWMVFKHFWYCWTLSVPQKLKNSIFEMPINTQNLNINNLRTLNPKFIKLHTIRKPVEWFLKNSLTKTMFTLIIFEILLSQERSVLLLVKLSTGSKALKFQ